MMVIQMVTMRPQILTTTIYLKPLTGLDLKVLAQELVI